MEICSILAQAAPEQAATGQYVPVDDIWRYITSLSWQEAVLAVSFGLVYMLYGWRIFRILVVISFGLGGMVLGMKAGQQMGGQVISQIWGGVVGLLILAFLAVPLMKWGVSILGAIAGGIVTGGIWYAAMLPEEYIWAGALVGCVAGGMMSFIVLKHSVMLFTSLGGSIVVSIGLLALLHQYEMVDKPDVTMTWVNNTVHNVPWFLPACLLFPTLVGIIAQNKLIKQSSKWEF